ncbi:MAG: hypothetical protein ACE5J3_14110 [Methanosarcinales archaeon]
MISSIELADKLHTLSDPTKLQIIALIQDKKKITSVEIKKSLNLSSNVVYKDLECSGFIESDLKKNIFCIRNFNLAINPEIISNIIKQEKEFLDFFTNKYGIQKISEFYKIFKEYEQGKITLRTMADELKIDYSELQWLIHDLGLDEKTEW